MSKMLLEIYYLYYAFKQLSLNGTTWRNNTLGAL